MEEPPSAVALRPHLEAFVQRTQRETGVPGIAVGVSIRGERVDAYAGSRDAGHTRALGAESRYHLGCVTKLLLAIVVLELVRDGTLSLDAAVGEYLPELAAARVGAAVRVAHLLSHTSGYRGTQLLDRSARPDDWDGFLAYLRATPLWFEPGAVFSYEHTESLLLAEIVRRVTGRTSLRHITERLLEPLGIAPGRLAVASHDDAGRHRYDERAGRFVALEHLPPLAPFWLPAFSDHTVTLRELLAIGEAVIGRRVPLAAATLAHLERSVVRLPPTAGGPLRELLPVAFGLGTAELRAGFRGSTGISAGQCLGLHFDAASGIAVAVALNATAPHLRDYILATLGRELGARRAPRTVTPFGLDLADFGGTYLGPGRTLAVARYEHGRMLCELGREDRPERLRVELALDADGALVLRSPIPQLALGFFVEERTDAVGLLVGLSAYRRSPV